MPRQLLAVTNIAGLFAASAIRSSSAPIPLAMSNFPPRRSTPSPRRWRIAWARAQLFPQVIAARMLGNFGRGDPAGRRGEPTTSAASFHVRRVLPSGIRSRSWSPRLARATPLIRKHAHGIVAAIERYSRACVYRARLRTRVRDPRQSARCPRHRTEQRPCAVRSRRAARRRQRGIERVLIQHVYEPIPHVQRAVGQLVLVARDARIHTRAQALQSLFDFSGVDRRARHDAESNSEPCTLAAASSFRSASSSCFDFSAGSCRGSISGACARHRAWTALVPGAVALERMRGCADIAGDPP